MTELDMSLLVGQDFDCEFWNYENSKMYLPLTAIRPEAENGFIYHCGEFSHPKGRNFKHCSPRLNHWHFNDGTMRLPDGLICRISNRPQWLYKSWTSRKYGAGLWLVKSPEKKRPLHKLDYDDSLVGLAVKILGLAEGYEHPGMEIIKV